MLGWSYGAEVGYLPDGTMVVVDHGQFNGVDYQSLYAHLGSADKSLINTPIVANTPIGKAGGSTLRDYKKADGELGYFQHHFVVYDCEGEPCSKHGCGGTIKRIVQAGRSTFYCPTCQK